MSDYYYFKNSDKDDLWGAIPVLGDDYIFALRSIASKHGITITDEMILDEIKQGSGLTKKIKGKTCL